MRIDIIISTYNRPDSARKVIESLNVQLTDKDRVFVVWQGKQKPDPDTSCLSIVSYVFSSPPNLPRARNRGIRSGTGDIILFLDDDVEVKPGLIEAHRNAYTDAHIGAIAGKIIDPVFTSANNQAALFNEKTGELTQNFCVKEPQDTISLMGANMSLRRSALERIGMFDESFVNNALWEDVDAAFRLRRAGYIIRYCPDACVVHARDTHGGCRSASRTRYLFFQFANTAYFAARHAKREYYASWFTYWKYRLEYESRRNVFMDEA
jgi:GT2 family glycosyltransferase